VATTVILIRHGETDWSYQKRYCGFSDIDLNENGRQQGRQLHRRLKKEKINGVYASDMKRTLQFAGIVLKGVPIEETADLRELNFGIFEGLTHEDIMKLYPQIYGKWLENPLESAIPQGESLHAMAQRVRRALRTMLSANTDKTVAVVTHGGPIKVIICDVLQLGLHKIWKIEQALASISIIEFVEGRGTIQILNDISHLHETALC
jgi:alpha-ribazole phosphatase